MYAPLVFTPGRTGRLFVEFALTLAGAVLVSGFVALMLTRMMCSQLLKREAQPNRFDRTMEYLLGGLTNGYTAALRWVLLGRRCLVVAGMLASAAGSAWLVIMTAVPLSMLGALLAMYWTGGTLNVYSKIGLITLIGLITKHGILIVEFSNQLRQEGVPMMEALIKSSSMRLRPILMTTGAMVLGALPLALATGAGAESRQQIGWVIVGGMSLGTLLTLFVVPTVYSLFARRQVPGANQTPSTDLQAQIGH